jgi:hypothetical protein
MSKSKHLPPIEDESDGTFAFIAGYTPGGFSYGTTWEELGITITVSSCLHFNWLVYYA